jgi:hypothetical protein
MEAAIVGFGRATRTGRQEWFAQVQDTKQPRSEQTPMDRHSYLAKGQDQRQNTKNKNKNKNKNKHKCEIRRNRGHETKKDVVKTKGKQGTKEMWIYQLRWYLEKTKWYLVGSKCIIILFLFIDATISFSEIMINLVQQPHL